MATSFRRAFSRRARPSSGRPSFSFVAFLIFGTHVAQTIGASWTLWVVLSAHTAIGLGTLRGGWRIVRTMGQRICKLRPIDGVCAETPSAVRWNVTLRIVWAWGLTIPAAGATGALAFLLVTSWLLP